MRKLFAICTACTVALSATAQIENQYIGPASGAIDTPANWSLGYIPTNSSEIGVIGSGDSVTTASGTTYSNYYLRVDSGASWSGSGLGGALMRDGELTLNGGTIQPFRGIDAYGSAYWNFISGTFNMADSDLELNDSAVLDMNGASISANSSKGLVLRGGSSIVNMYSGNIGTSTNTSGDINYLGGNAFFGGVGGTFNMYGGDVYANAFRAGRNADMTFIIHGTSGSMFGRGFNYPSAGRVVIDFRSGSTIPVTVASTGWAETLWDADELKFDGMNKTALGGASWATVTSSGGLDDYYFLESDGATTLRVALTVPSRAYDDKAGGVTAGKAIVVGTKIFVKPGPWTPINATGLAAWYDANDLDTITESAGFVSQWDDKSGNDYHLTQDTGASQPEVFATNLNANNVFRFDGSNDQLANAALGALLSGNDNTLAVFGVFKFDDRASTAAVWSLFNTGDSNPLYYFGTSGGGTTWRRLRRDDSGTSTDNQATSADNDAHVLSCQFSGTQCTEYLDGSELYAKSSNLGQSTYNRFTVGARDVADIPLDGIVCEIVVLADQATTAERQKLEGYLAWKWGLEGSLPSDHPYKDEMPLNN